MSLNVAPWCGKQNAWIDDSAGDCLECVIGLTERVALRNLERRLRKRIRQYTDGLELIRKRLEDSK